MMKPIFMAIVGGLLLASSPAHIAKASGIDNIDRKLGSALPYTVLRSDISDNAKPGNMLEIRNGGFGSDMTAHPTNPNQFYALTDRGPNATFKGEQGKGKLFPTSDYTPRIGLFEVREDGSIWLVQSILLKRPNGEPITGLPNTSDLGGTGETPYDKDGNPITIDLAKPFDEITNPLKLDNYGLDGEGLVALKDGTFWVSDEYGPHIVHFDSFGVEIDRINAFPQDKRTSITLPEEFANRRANRGMEGLAVTPDESTLVGIMQSTMYNPDKSVKKLNLVRIVTINLKSKEIGQYLYKQEKTQNSNSGIAALSGTEFLVIERDGAFLAKKPDAMKRLYRIDLSVATDIEEIEETPALQQNPKIGLTIKGKTLEQSVLENGWEVLDDFGIKPVGKELVSDLVEVVQYPHDKLEGIWLIDSSTVGVINDDDFATWATKGKLEQKYLDEEKTKVDGNTLYVIDGLKLK